MVECPHGFNCRSALGTRNRKRIVDRDPPRVWLWHMMLLFQVREFSALNVRKDSQYVNLEESSQRPNRKVSRPHGWLQFQPVFWLESIRYDAVCNLCAAKVRLIPMILGPHRRLVARLCLSHLQTSRKISTSAYMGRFHCAAATLYKRRQRRRQ